MAFQLPTDLEFNRGMIHDPSDYAVEAGCASWLFLVGDGVPAILRATHSQD